MNFCVRREDVSNKNTKKKAHIEGVETYKEIKTLPIAVHGMIDVIEEVGAEVVPTIFLYADAGGHFGRCRGLILRGWRLKLLPRLTQHYLKRI